MNRDQNESGVNQLGIRLRGNLGVVLERRPQCAVSHEVRRRGQ